MLYSVVWMAGAVIGLIWAQSLWMIPVALIVYPLFWIAAEWDPHFIDVVTIVSKKTRRTKNKDYWDADSYEP